jgi:abortive infection bacteriophage resistance protein
MVQFYDKTNKTFLSNTTFEDITTLYYFDSELRLLLMKVLEVIEVDFKTRMINNLSLKYNNAHWFMDKQHFITQPAYRNVQRIIQGGIKKNNDAVFIKHYY